MRNNFQPRKKKKNVLQRLQLPKRFRAFRIWLADKILPKGNWHVLSVKDDINPDFVTKQKVDEAINQWVRNTKKSLYDDLIKQYCQHTWVNLGGIRYVNYANKTVHLHRVLPTWQEIVFLVNDAFDTHNEKVIACETNSDLSYILSALKQEHDKLHNDISGRVALFKEYAQKADESECFVGKLRCMRDAVRKFQRLPVSEHNHTFEHCLMTTLTTNIDLWDVFCGNGQIVALENFHKRIASTEKIIAVLWGQTFPQKENGCPIDLESYVSGFQAGLESPSNISKKGGKQNRKR